MSTIGHPPQGQGPIEGNQPVQGSAQSNSGQAMGSVDNRLNQIGTTTLSAEDQQLQRDIAEIEALVEQIDLSGFEEAPEGVGGDAELDAAMRASKDTDQAIEDLLAAPPSVSEEHRIKQPKPPSTPSPREFRPMGEDDFGRGGNLIDEDMDRDVDSRYESDLANGLGNEPEEEVAIEDNQVSWQDALRDTAEEVKVEDSQVSWQDALKDTANIDKDERKEALEDTLEALGIGGGPEISLPSMKDIQRVAKRVRQAVDNFFTGIQERASAKRQKLDEAVSRGEHKHPSSPHKYPDAIKSDAGKSLYLDIQGMNKSGRDNLLNRLQDPNSSQFSKLPEQEKNALILELGGVVMQDAAEFLSSESIESSDESTPSYREFRIIENEAEGNLDAVGPEASYAAIDLQVESSKPPTKEEIKDLANNLVKQWLKEGKPVKRGVVIRAGNDIYLVHNDPSDTAASQDVRALNLADKYKDHQYIRGLIPADEQ